MPTLMFCAGTVKSGTSWLHAYLRDHPEAYFRTIKETRFFLSLEGDWRRHHLRKLDEETAAMEENLASGKASPTPYNLRQIADRKEFRKVMTNRANPVAAYVDYLAGKAGQRKVAGELTPEYGMLPDEWIGRINALAPDVRWVLLLRDPVSRLWSHIRMMVKRQKLPEDRFEAGCLAEFDKVLSGQSTEIEVRGDYATILGRLMANVPEEKRLVMVYEQLISQPGVDRITDFLGLSRHPARIDRVVHGGIALDLAPALRARAREWLRPQYEFVARVMGLPPEWEAFPEYRSEVA